MDTTPPEFRLTIWRWYIDHALEMVQGDKWDEQREHVNTIDNQIRKWAGEGGYHPLLDAHISRKGDGGVKVQVYKKETHTDQYLSCCSHNLLNHKLGVIRTLYEWCDNIVTVMEEAYMAAEIIHMDKALGRCGYPKWSFKWSVRESMDKINHHTNKYWAQDGLEEMRCTCRNTQSYIPSLSLCDQYYRKGRGTYIFISCFHFPIKWTIHCILWRLWREELQTYT